MPQGAPLELLKRLGLVLPDEMPPANEELQNQIAEKEQSTWSPWRKAADQLLISAPVEALRGFLGLDPQERSGLGRAVNIGTQISQAGMPFATLMRGKPAYHGTKAVFDKFDPKLSREGDLLGRYLHFSQRPDYASRAAIEDLGFGANPSTPRPNVIPAQIEAQNVLDLVQPEMDDLSQAVASMPGPMRREAIDIYKGNMREFGPLEARDMLVRYLSDTLNSPEAIQKLPFDAIRYSDIGNPSFAVPASTPIRSYYSNQLLNDPPRPLTVKRLPDDAPIGNLELSPGRSYFNKIIKPRAHHPDFGDLTKDEAAQLVSGGEIPISWYEKYF